MTLFHNRACFLYQMQLRWADSKEYSDKCTGRLPIQSLEPAIVSEGRSKISTSNSSSKSGNVANYPCHCLVPCQERRCCCTTGPAIGGDTVGETSKDGVLVATYLPTFEATRSLKGDCALAYARVKGWVVSYTSIGAIYVTTLTCYSCWL